MLALQDPSYVVVSPRRRALYAASHVRTFRGAPGGGLTAFALREPGSTPAKLGDVVVPNAHPAFLELDRTERHLFAASTFGGGVAVFAIEESGALAPATQSVHHEGRPARLDPPETPDGWPPLPANAPMPHAAVPDRANRHVAVPDARLDRIFVYAFDPASGTLRVPPVAAVRAPPGSAPRQIRFSADGTRAYVVFERASTVGVYRYDDTQGHLRELQTIGIRDPGASGENVASDLRISRDGRTLYATNRGDDTIAVLSLADDGMLRTLQVAPSGGSWPRALGLTPDGRFLLAANQHSGAVVTFAVDETDGRLTPTGRTTRIPFPTSFAFAAQ